MDSQKMNRPAAGMTSVRLDEVNDHNMHGTDSQRDNIAAAGMTTSRLDEMEDHHRRGTRYSTRSQPSLENTNVASMIESETQNNVSDATDSDKSNFNLSQGNTMDVKTQDETKECKDNTNLCTAMQNETDELEKIKEWAGHGTPTPTADEVDEVEAKQKKDVKDLQLIDHRQFEGEKSMPWLRMDPHVKNLSEEMFLYLTHKEMCQKMDDLAKREQHALNKNCWDEALRLRDMHNRLELAREKRMFNMKGLRLDNDVKRIALANIEKREEELNGREYACADSTMYSDEAKDLWKKWVQEDEASVIKDARFQRETLMKKLEEEWHNLAIDDKEKISKSFDKNIYISALQDE